MDKCTRNKYGATLNLYGKTHSPKKTKNSSFSEEYYSKNNSRLCCLATDAGDDRRLRSWISDLSKFRPQETNTTAKNTPKKYKFNVYRPCILNQ